MSLLHGSHRTPYKQRSRFEISRSGFLRKLTLQRRRVLQDRETTRVSIPRFPSPSLTSSVILLRLTARPPVHPRYDDRRERRRCVGDLPIVPSRVVAPVCWRFFPVRKITGRPRKSFYPASFWSILPEGSWKRTTMSSGRRRRGISELDVARTGLLSVRFLCFGSSIFSDSLFCEYYILVLLR